MPGDCSLQPVWRTPPFPIVRHGPHSVRSARANASPTASCGLTGRTPAFSVADRAAVERRREIPSRPALSLTSLSIHHMCAAGKRYSVFSSRSSPSVSSSDTRLPAHTGRAPLSPSFSCKPLSGTVPSRPLPPHCLDIVANPLTLSAIDFPPCADYCVFVRKKT